MLATFLAALLLAAPLTPGQSFPDWGEPIVDEAYIEDLLEADLENGKLPAGTLLPIESSSGCLLEEEAAEAWMHLEIHAANAGIELVARWCYRDLAAQRRTYRRNCPRTIVIVDPPPPANGEESPAGGQDPSPQGDTAAQPTVIVGPRICSPPTATPGNSNHGWGRAVDIKVQGRLLTCASEGFEWLQDNAHLYGWVHPAWAACGEPKQEAWHWEWGGTQPMAQRVANLRDFAT